MSSQTNSWVGTTIADGRYRISEQLGAGGMAIVFLAVDCKLDQKVVIKVPRLAILDDPALAERFQREVRSLAALEHLHIVKIRDVGEHRSMPFIVMQYLAGGCLRERQKLDQEGQPLPVSPESLRDWLPSVADALDFIHRRDYVHRDVKPPNILFDEQGHAYLSDFGVAKALANKELRSTENSLTGGGMVMGTSEYIAPELCEEKPFDGRVDQYSLAITTYELLAGRRPIEGSTAMVILLNQIRQKPLPLQKLVPSIPKALAAAVHRGLAKDPANRFPNCTSFATAVLSAVGQAATSSTQTDPTGVIPPQQGVTSGIRLDPDRKSESLACPNCGKRIKLPASAAGRKVRCRSCQQVCRVSKDITRLQAVVEPTAASPSGSPEQPPVEPFHDMPFVPVNEPFGDAEEETAGLNAPSTPAGSIYQPLSSTTVGGGIFVLLFAILLFALDWNNGRTTTPFPDSVALKNEDPGGSSVTVAKPDQSDSEKPPKKNLYTGVIWPLPDDDKDDKSDIPDASRPRPHVSNQRSLEGTSTNSIGMKLNLIPAGEFMMGSPETEAERGNDEGPQHRVRITKPFYLGVHEVTQAEYEKVMGQNPRDFSKVGGRDTSRFPVENVSWYDAVEFCNRLSEREKLKPYYVLSGIERGKGHIEKAAVNFTRGKGYRLPTEAEWEYACRAGTTTPFHFGSRLNGTEANVSGNYPYGTTTKGPYLKRPTTVGSYGANAFGLYDMHGNVWEWCADWYGTDYYGKPSVNDPDGPSAGSCRVFRGGSWGFSAGCCRSALRNRDSPGIRSSSLGFRVAIVPPER